MLRSKIDHTLSMPVEDRQSQATEHQIRRIFETQYNYIFIMKSYTKYNKNRTQIHQLQKYSYTVNY